MPKNTVSDPITDQEMAYAHLLMSGTMTDRRAAEAVGLNPETAAYTKAKPRVRAYMNEHRAAVRAKLVDQEAEGLRKLNISRDQILDRLWELATLSHEVTRGIIAGQIRALSMIIAIEGLIPGPPLLPIRDPPRGPARRGADIYGRSVARQTAAGRQPVGEAANGSDRHGSPTRRAPRPRAGAPLAPKPANDAPPS